jgi:large subunit ribosomal protein L18
VFRSNVHIYAQAINDVDRVTITTVTSKAIKEKKTKTDIAKVVGQMLGEKLKERKIEKGIFDRGSYRYHGRVARVAEGIREAGIQM